MRIRAYEPGDEGSQQAVYNAAGAYLPNFKPATLVEIQRRARGQSSDPALRLYAEDQGKVVGYCVGHANGRVSYPWCLPDFEQHQLALFQAVLQALRDRGQRQVFAAYRPDWKPVHEFFLNQGFHLAREWIGYSVVIHDLPTTTGRPLPISSPERSDLPALFELAPELLRVRSAEQWERELFHNPYFGPESLFMLRGRDGSAPRALGILITEPTYADPRVLDANMPCFRLGAFGTEGLQTKRVKGMFSFLAPQDKSLPSTGLDLLSYALSRLEDHDDIDSLAAQAPTDQPALTAFYDKYFRKQGSFPVFEADLNRL